MSATPVIDFTYFPKHVMKNCNLLAFTVYLILSTNFTFIQSASFTLKKETDDTSSLEAKIRSLKIEGNGPCSDPSEIFEKFQETGPFRINHLKPSVSSESLNSISSGGYSPLARLALSNSQKDNSVAIQGEEVNKLVFEAADEEVTEDN